MAKTFAERDAEVKATGHDCAQGKRGRCLAPMCNAFKVAAAMADDAGIPRAVISKAIVDTAAHFRGRICPACRKLYRMSMAVMRDFPAETMPNLSERDRADNVKTGESVAAALNPDLCTVPGEDADA